MIRKKVYYGWIIVASTFLIGVAMFGTRWSFGIFFKSLESEFGMTRAATSGIYSTYMLLAAVFSIMAGWALDKYGPRLTVTLSGIFTVISLILTSQASAAWQLFITYGLLMALGTGTAYTLLMATVSRWFTSRRGLALGITGAGGGMGIIVLAPFSAYLISNFDWRTSYIVLGLVAGTVIISLAQLLRNNAKTGHLPDADRPEDQARVEQASAQTAEFSARQVLSNGNFWLLWFAWLLQAVAVHLTNTHIVPHATDTGIPALEAAVIISVIGGSSILGRLIAGIMADIRGRKAAAVVSALLGVAAMIWLPQIKELWMFYVFAVMFGLSWGGLSIMVTVLIGDTFGMSKIGTIMGWQGVAWSIGSAVGPAMGGFIFDINHSYSAAFIIEAFALLIAAFLIILLRKQYTE